MMLLHALVAEERLCCSCSTQWWGTGGGAENARACRAGAICAWRVFSTGTVDTASC